MQERRDLKVLVDATGVSKDKAGVGVYAKNLLAHLLDRIDGSFHLYILVQDDDPELVFSHDYVTMLFVPARIFRRLPLRVVMEQIYIPWLLLTLRIDALHSLHYAFPLISFGTHRVVTVHDLTFLVTPEHHERVKIHYFGFFLRASVRRADHIIFISKSSRQDYLNILGTPSGTTSVIPHGKDEIYRPGNSCDDWDLLCSRLGIRGRFVLFIGTIEPRKNLTRLVQAFATIAEQYPDLNLVFAGRMGWMCEGLTTEIGRLGLGARIIFTGFISDAEKLDLLRKCTIFAYPSLYEGFGLPALEAIACGTPTITSNISSLPEVVGDAALLVDPMNVGEIAGAMQQLLNDDVLREDLRRRGPIQAAPLTWEQTARLTAAVYAKEITNKRTPERGAQGDHRHRSPAHD